MGSGDSLIAMVVMIRTKHLFEDHVDADANIDADVDGTVLIDLWDSACTKNKFYGC